MEMSQLRYSGVTLESSHEPKQTERERKFQLGSDHCESIVICVCDFAGTRDFG